jgi:hypothetical protein
MMNQVEETDDWHQMAEEQRQRQFAERLKPIKRRALWDSWSLGVVLIGGGFLALLSGILLGISILFGEEDWSLDNLNGVRELVLAALITMATGWAIWKGR